MVPPQVTFFRSAKDASSMLWWDVLKQAVEKTDGAVWTVERRVRFRLLCTWLVELVPSTGLPLLARAVDVNTRGICVLLPRSLRRQQHVQVTMRGPVTSSPLILQAHVIWCRDLGAGTHRAGLEFLHLLPDQARHVLQFLQLNMQSQQLDDEQRRRNRRVAVDWTAEVFAGQSPIGRTVRIVETSRCGFRIYCPVPLLLRAFVRMRVLLPGSRTAVEVDGVVRRCVKSSTHELWDCFILYKDLPASARRRIERAVLQTISNG